MVTKMFLCVVIYLSIRVKPREFEGRNLCIYKFNLLNRLVFTSTGICSAIEMKISLEI